MSAKETVKYIAALLNVKAESEFVMMDMLSEIEEVKNPAAYREYLRDNFNHIDVTMMPGFQKFITLTKRYKEIEFQAFNHDRIEKSQSTAREIAEKVKNIAPMVLVSDNIEKKLEFKHFQTNGKPYFTDFEIKTLNKIGSVRHCVKLQRSNSGDDLLLRKLEKMMIEMMKKPKLLPKSEGERRVLALIRRAVA